MANAIIDSFDLWTTAQSLKTSNRGLSASNQSLLGIKKLRELILDLAIQGKLVPQDSQDESAIILRGKIEKEKLKLIKSGEIRKLKVLPEITEDEIPFNLPDGWIYLRMNDLGDWGAGATPNRGRLEYYGGDIPWFKSGELNGGYIKQAEEFVTQLALKETSLRFNKVGDVLIAMYGATIGKTSILEIPATTNQAVCACTPFPGVYNVFLLTLLKAYKSRFIGMGAGGAQPNISREKLIATVTALPPLVEQHRIVSKVDELMVLCDQLEQQQTNSNAAHQTLVDNLLGTLTNAKSPAAFDEAWKRIASHFDTLLTTEHSIDQLKQTILQLAVMGKLVPQNSDDEPASELLKKIAKEKARLGKEGKIKKQVSIPDISHDEKLFELPEGWKWARLGLVGIGSTGKTPSTNISRYFSGSTPFIGPGQITPKREIIESDTFLTDEGCNYSTIADFGDIIMVCIGGSIGKSAIVKSKIAFNQQLNCIRPIIVDSSYLYIAMNAPYFQSSILLSASGSATPIINRTKWEEIPIPLPPLNEQRLVVSKVNELFALCNALKERLSDAQTLQNQLAVAVVEQAV